MASMLSGIFKKSTKCIGNRYFFLTILLHDNVRSPRFTNHLPQNKCVQRSLVFFRFLTVSSFYHEVESWHKRQPVTWCIRDFSKRKDPSFRSIPSL